MEHSSQKILACQVEQVFSNQKSSLLSNLLVSVILAYILRNQCTLSSVIVWCALVYFISGVRLFFTYRFSSDSNHGKHPQKWANIYTTCLFLSGLAWGSITLICFPEQSIVHQVFVSFVLGGMVIGTSASSSALKYRFYLYCTPILLPLIWKFFSFGDELHSAMGDLLVIFTLFSSFFSQNIFTTTLKSFEHELEKDEEIRVRVHAEENLYKHQKNLEKEIRQRTDELEDMNKSLTKEIDERKKIEKELLEKQAQYKLLFEKGNDGIFVYMNNSELTPSRFIDVNSKASEMLGYSKEELLTFSPKDLVLAERWHEIPAIIQKKQQSDGKIIFPTTLVRKDNTPIEVEINDHSFKIDDRFITLSIVRDISERVHLEQETYKNENLRSLGTLAGGIAHDFNNLLTAVIGNVELAGLTLSNQEKTKKLLNQASEALKGTSDLTRKLLTFSKGGEPTKKALPLPPLIQDASSFALSGSDIICSYDFPETTWSANVDRRQMEQVINHIVINAKEAMEHDGGVLKISVKNKVVTSKDTLPLPAGNYIQCDILDNGKGIEKEIISKIFDPYFSSKGKGNKRGTGLGLSICHSIIQKHKGHICVHSQLGKGTKFTFYLPAIESTGNSLDQIRTTDAQTKGTHHSKKILVLEDEASVANIVVEMLNHLGYESQTAETGEKALQLYIDNQKNQTPFDLAILDLTIRGGLGGKETAEKIIAINPKAYLIVSSGHADSEVLSNFEAYGFKAAIEKPFSLLVLKNELDLAFLTSRIHSLFSFSGDKK